MTLTKTSIVWSVIVGSLIACSAMPAAASDKLSFSGKYVGQAGKNAVGDKNVSTLEVVQSDDAVEITRTESNKTTVSRYPLNGSDGDYASPGGAQGKCRAQLKPKYLLIEYSVVTRPQQNGPLVRIHTKEKWQLSADGKTLTIKSEVDFPDFPADISAAVAENSSGTTKYSRVIP